MFVALFTRAWIEIVLRNLDTHSVCVALFTRAWIEIEQVIAPAMQAHAVALFTRAWIEIQRLLKRVCEGRRSPSLRGRGLKSEEVAKLAAETFSRPLYEGVD